MSGRWEYLDSEPFRLRYAIAADLLAYHCAELLEIGAVGRGIAAQGGPMNFVDITLVGPGVDIGFGVETGYDVPFQNVEREWLDPAPDGVLLMGLALEGMTEPAWQHLADLVSGAKRTVLEYPPAHALSIRQAQWISTNTETRIQCHFDLDLRRVPSEDPRVERFGLRRFCVLEPLPSVEEREPGAELECGDGC